MDELNLREDALLIEKNGVVVLGDASAVTYESLPPIRPRPADDAPRSFWVDYVVDLGANREIVEADPNMSSVIDLMSFANSMGG